MKCLPKTARGFGTRHNILPPETGRTILSDLGTIILDTDTDVCEY